jgi:hypothetical protein
MQPIMKTKQISQRSIFFSFLDKYIYYVVVNKRHKKSIGISSIGSANNLPHISKA